MPICLQISAFINQVYHAHQSPTDHASFAAHALNTTLIQSQVYHISLSPRVSHLDSMRVRMRNVCSSPR